MTDISILQADWAQDKDQLTNVRTRVFIEEQKVPVDLEIDGLDPQCLHVKALNQAGIIVGTARLLPNHYIGRMCVDRPYRQHGVGGGMLQFFIDYAHRQHFPALMLNAQISALDFYQKYGFVADSEIFLEADIAHRHMTLDLTQ